MATLKQYGYISPSYGNSYYKPPAQKPITPLSPLAQAAGGRASQADPFGLGVQGQFARQFQGYTGDTTGQPTGRTVIPAATGQGAGAAVTPPAAKPPAAPAAVAPVTYDLGTDPALQQITALTGFNDEQATAAALKQKQQQLIGFGDSKLAAALLGEGDPTVQAIADAAAKNPGGSTVGSLRQQHERGLKQLVDALNPQNLLYSGYRVTQEQQASQDYQNALAQAAAGVNTNLDTIRSNLVQALAQNQGQRTSAMSDAESRLIQAAIANGAAGAGSSTAPAEPPPPTGPPPVDTPTVDTPPAGPEIPGLIGAPGASYPGTAGGGQDVFFPGAARPSGSGLDLIAAALGNTLVNRATQPKRPAAPVDIARLLGGFRG